MSEIIAFGIIFLAGLSHALLQLNLGGLLLLYHSSLGKNITKTTKALISKYILGIVIITLLGIFTVSFFITNYFDGHLKLELLSASVGVLMAISIIIWFAYYRTGYSTELWLPKSVANFINKRAKQTSSKTEAFSLGLLTGFAEFPLSAILVIVSADSFLSLSYTYRFLGLSLYLLILILPLLMCRIFVKRGNTIAKIQRWRLKNRKFLKFIAGMNFFILALFIFTFKILGYLI